MSAEQDRLRSEREAWLLWGPYLSERAWGTVREDYSADGSAWNYLPHDMARSHVYRWNEDGLGGICDGEQHLCFAIALWNGRDPILKERLFGLSGPEGNHGEDVKECYFYLDSTPTHSYMRMLYKYPQAPFPYDELVQVNRQRTRNDPEYELLDTGVFDQDRYFDVFIEYAKVAPDDILIRISATNRGPEPADLLVLPTLWYRNRWDWGYGYARPRLSAEAGTVPIIRADHPTLGIYRLYCECAGDLLFTDNETNAERCYGVPNQAPYTKDAFHRAIVNGQHEALNPQRTGTKGAARYTQRVAPGSTATIRLRLTSEPEPAPFERFEQAFAERQREADQFYAELQPATMSEERKLVQRQALAGMLWSKQYYHYDINHWLKGDPAQPSPPPQRLGGRNHDWSHLTNNHVLSMPDKWEYPWYASWDLAFHCITLALVDIDFAKQQIELLVRATYQHPNGQIPAYEWAFGDVNPPVLSWAALRLFQMEEKYRGKGDRAFLERVFHKLLLSFTWWVNRKDSEGNNVFAGGFLGLDNIGVFDRSAPLPTGGFLEQSDGTSWMGMFCLDMFNISLLLAEENHVYEDVATKFFEHFLYIAGALSDIGAMGIDLWDVEDEFFYDVLRLPDGAHFPLKVRSLVGLIPLFAVTTIEPEQLK
ncbi:MAG TPA: glucosidase, partial [Chloroflexota bacterium]|nr:glucosidase [Chloroflexota bacterium]